VLRGARVFKAVVLQAGLILLAALLIFPWLDVRGAQSVVLGGLAYLLPNLFFVARLRLSASRGTASAATFFVGELAKVVATIALLVVVFRFFEVHWLALLIGLFVALKANLFAFLLKT
jgi:ATP synthase protein I